MVDVRKCFVVLALFALIAGGAYGQVSCTVSAVGANNLPIRDTGLAELVGTITMDCTNPGVATDVNFGAEMNSTVTNKIATAATLELSGPTLQLIRVGGATVTSAGFLQPRIATGDVPSTRNRVLFAPVTIPAGTTSQVVISGIRVVAPPASVGFSSTFVTETITTSPVGEASITPATSIVATVLPALSVSLRTCNDAEAFTPAAFAQCISEPRGATGAWNFNIRFREEGDPSMFKTLAHEGVGADRATRLRAKFTNIPAGVEVWVSTGQVAGSTEAAGTFVAATASISTGAISGVDDRTGQICPASAQTATFRRISVSSGTAVAEWNITAENQTAFDRLAFGVQIRFTSNTTSGLPGVTTTSGPAKAQGQFGSVSAVDFADTSSALPRFRDVPLEAGNIFTVVPCVTNLLFPYVTFGAGWDTGIAITNTSLDQSGTTGEPFATPTQTGTCTAFYFTKPGSTAPAPQTTAAAVQPGEVIAFALSQGGVPDSGSTVPAGFTGYMIVRCNFQFAHGFAFISDLGANRVSHGYLALVIPDRTREPSPFSTGLAGTGETLGN